MAVAFSGSGTTVSGTTATISVPFPASVPAGAYALLFVESGEGTAPAAPAGWGLVWSGSAGATGTDIGGVKGYIYDLLSILTDGTEGGTSVTVNRTNGHTLAKIMVYTGVDGTTPINLSSTSLSAVADTAFSTASIDAKAGDSADKFLSVGFHDRDSATASGISQGFNGLTGETTNARIATSTNSGGGGGILVVEGLPASDSTGAVSATGTVTSTIWVGVLARLNATGSMGGGGSGPYTLTVAGGAYVLTGSAVTLRTTRKLAVAGGAYAVAGTAVTLTYTPWVGPRSYTITVEPGEYLLESHGVAMSKVARVTFVRENDPTLAATVDAVPED